MYYKKLIIILLMVSTALIYYQISEPVIAEEEPHLDYLKTKIVRVLDGDTFEIEDGRKVRLLGVNTPETGELNALEAHTFSDNYLNKTVILRNMKEDRYGRILAYVFYNNDLINKELLRRGLAHSFYYEIDEYYSDFMEAERKAMNEGIGIWRKSSRYGCVRMEDFIYTENGKRCTNRESMLLVNSCGSFRILIKDDATHMFHEILNEGTTEFKFSCIWNDGGDSVFIWDDEGLVLFYRYP